MAHMQKIGQFGYFTGKNLPKKSAAFSIAMKEF